MPAVHVHGTCAYPIFLRRPAPLTLPTTDMNQIRLRRKSRTLRFTSSRSVTQIPVSLLSSSAARAATPALHCFGCSPRCASPHKCCAPSPQRLTIGFSFRRSVRRGPACLTSTASRSPALSSPTPSFIVTQFIRQVQKARQSRARVVRGGVRKATKGKAAAGGKAAGGKK